MREARGPSIAADNEDCLGASQDGGRIAGVVADQQRRRRHIVDE